MFRPIACPVCKLSRTVPDDFTDVSLCQYRRGRPLREAQNITVNVVHRSSCCSRDIQFTKQQKWQASTSTLTRSPSTATRASVASLQRSTERPTVCIYVVISTQCLSSDRLCKGYLIGEPEAGFTRTLFLVCMLGTAKHQGVMLEY